MTHAEFIEFSAVMSGIKEIKQVMAEAERARQYGTRTIVFVDEIHRFNKAQQDAFLPYVEKGSIRLIGATTENPSFEIISALLSRCRVYILQALTEQQIVALLRRALADTDRGLGDLQSRCRRRCARKDRRLLQRRRPQRLQRARSRRHARPGTKTTSASPKPSPPTPCRSASSCTTSPARSTTTSSRPCTRACATAIPTPRSTGSPACSRPAKTASTSPVASSAWPSEDIGLADPNALNITLTARDAVDFLGMPEGNLALAQAVVYLCAAPKSNALYTAYGAVQEDVERTAQDPVPLHLRNAPTSFMKSVGYGAGYQYAHDLDEKVADMQCLPDNLKDRVYYHPTEEGIEKRIKARLEEIREAEDQLTTEAQRHREVRRAEVRSRRSP